MSTWYDSGAEDDLIADEAAYKRYMEQLQAHPDCGDPEHPGCDACDFGEHE